MAWIRSFNRLLWQPPEEEGTVRFDEVWKKSRAGGDRGFRWNINYLWANSACDVGNFFDKVHYFYNEMDDVVKFSNTSHLPSRRAKIKSRKSKLTNNFKNYMGVKDFETSKRLYLKKAKSERIKLKNARLKKAAKTRN